MFIESQNVERRLQHNLHMGPGLFFQLRDEIDREAFFGILDVLEGRAGPTQTGSREEHWEALRERVAGRSRWDTIVTGLPKRPETKEERAVWAETIQTATKILKRRPYTSYVVDGIQYVVDVFNPANELELQYAGAGEPVIAVLLNDITSDPKQVEFSPLPVRDRLGEIESFYRILADLVGRLKPAKVAGGNYLARVMLAYHHGELSSDTSPWDLLWTLTSVRASELEGIPREALLKEFSKIIEIPPGEVTLLQVVPRCDSVMSREYVRAARLLGRTAVTEIGERRESGPGRQRG